MFPIIRSPYYGVNNNSFIKNRLHSRPWKGNYYFIKPFSWVQSFLTSLSSVRKYLFCWNILIHNWDSAFRKCRRCHFMEARVLYRISKCCMYWCTVVSWTRPLHTSITCLIHSFLPLNRLVNSKSFTDTI